MKKDLETEINKTIFKKMCDANCPSRDFAKFFGYSTKALEKVAKKRNLKIKNIANSGYFVASQSICWFCKNTNAHKCSWFDNKNQKPRDDWKATKTYIPGGQVEGQRIVSYIVHECDGFEMEE